MFAIATRVMSREAPRRSEALLLLVLALIAFTLSGCKSDLYTKLQEREANEMLALLLVHDIDATRVVAKDGTSALQVGEEQRASAIAVMKANGLPRQTFKNMGEVFKGAGLISSPTEERARYVYALSEELSKTISDIDGVLTARIHVVLPKNDLLRQDTTPSSASVFIRHDSRAELHTLLSQIKMLVANSIEGLSYDKVSVVFVPVDRETVTESQTAVKTVATGRSARWAAFPWGVAVLTGLAGAMFTALGFVWFARRQRPEAISENQSSSTQTSAMGNVSALRKMA
jgi:type III secretion protein J